MPGFKNQNGVAPVLLLMAVVALVGFVIASNLLSFNKGLFGMLFPKSNSRASGVVDLSLLPSYVTVAPNDVFTVDVRIDAKTEPVTGVQYLLRWDATKLQALSMTKGTFLNAQITEPAIGVGAASYALYVGLSCSNPADPNSCAPNPPSTGQGILATVTFKALQNTTVAANITFDSSQTIVSSQSTTTNVVGGLNPAAVTISTTAVVKTATLALAPTSANVVVGGDLAVTVKAQSDTDSANLYAAKINFDATKFEVTSIDTASSGIPGAVWLLDSDFPITSGRVSVTAGKPSPGFKTTGSAVNMAVIHFKPIASGTGVISLDGTSAVYRDSDNSNILQSPTTTVNATITGGALPTPSPTPVPTATPIPTSSPTPIPTVPGATPTPTPTVAPTTTPVPTATPAPVACSVTGATWNSSVNPLTQGDLVSMTVQGTGLCQGVGVSFEVRQDNGIFGSSPITNNPVSVPFNASNQAIGNWISEYQPSGPFGMFDPPRYFFNASLTGISTVFQSTGMLLSVNKLPQNTFVQGDSNRNGVVDLQDLSVIFSNYNKLNTDVLFPSNADVAPDVPDGKINAFDIAKMHAILRGLSIL